MQRVCRNSGAASASATYSQPTPDGKLELTLKPNGSSADVYLIDKNVADIGRILAVSIGLASMVAGWIIYNLLCASPLAKQ